MGTINQRISVLQAICGTAIIVAYFLPWLQISILGFEKSASLIDIIIKILEYTSKINKYSVQADVYTTFYPFLLLFIPMIAMINAILQWVWKSIHTAFYLNLIPLSICIYIIYVLSDMINTNKDALFEIVGPGYAITLIASIISTAHSWTVTAKSYVRDNNKYLKYTSNTVITSLIIGIIINIITKSNSFELLDSHSEVYERILGSIGSIAWIITLTHLPFILYAWIVALSTQQKVVLISENHTKEIYPNSEEKELICPNCHKKMEAEWKICPYCGYGKDDEKKDEDNNKTSIEDDNLRFAPPEYRTNK